MQSQHPEANARRVHANGLDFAYLQEGEGPLVLLMHGFPDVARAWDGVRPALARAGYCAVSPWMRGYAPTALPDADTDAETLGRDVLGLIDALGYDDAIVVGHDWGAMAAFAAVALEPARIRKLVTLAIPHPLGFKPGLGDLWRARHFVTYKLPGAARRFAASDFHGLDEIVARWSPTWDPGQDELQPIRNSFSAPGCVDAALGYYRALSFKPADVLRPKIAVPTLAIAGTEDGAAPVSAFHDAARRFTGPYEVVELSAGHFPHREQPEAFERALLEFLGPASR